MAISPQRPALGARRRRFVLERPLEEPDGFGGVLRRYVAGPVLWGAMAPAGLDPTMRLAAGPRRFAIRAVAEPDARGRDLVCHVEELPGEGRS